MELIKQKPPQILTSVIHVHIVQQIERKQLKGRKPKAMEAVNGLWFQLLIFLSVASIARSDDCVYTAYVRTGSIIKGGTDSNIGLTLYDVNGWGIQISNIVSWGGLMGPDYNYFERGNLDIFSGKGPCLTGPVCAMNLTSDGSGPHHGWYCNYVEVTTTGAHVECSQQLFTVEEWLATDTSPYELTAVRDYCRSDGGKARDGGRVRVINGDGGGVVSVVGPSRARLSV